MIVNSKDTVLKCYPKAECREITSPSGSYYMIYDMRGVTPTLLGFDISEENDLASEAKAWNMVAEKICEKVISILETE